MYNKEGTSKCILYRDVLFSIVSFIQSVIIRGSILYCSLMYGEMLTLVSLSLSLSGPKHDHVSAREYIAKMFININDMRAADIYPHFTCATDTENIKFVFDVVKNHILQQHITEVVPGL